MEEQKQQNQKAHKNIMKDCREEETIAKKNLIKIIFAKKRLLGN